MPGNAGRKAARRRQGLAQCRKAAGLTQEQLAGLLDVATTTVARWESGETEPQPWLWPKLARALEVSPERFEALLSEAGPASPGPGGPGGAAAIVPRQLPAGAADFTGRAEELAVLTRILEETADAPGAVVISAIGGTAGIGKTALALHWAHLVAGRFGAGQLHVNLRGFDPSGSPLSPEVAIRGFMDALGVPPDRVPAQSEAQAGLYRSLLADRKMLIVLDNARDEAQVRPLLPASPGSLVLVTSRRQLSGLAAADGARLLSLDVLAQEEAIELLATRLGADRAEAEPDAIGEIAALCAYLPLALTVAAARAVARPGFPLAALAAELRDVAGRFDALDAGDPPASVRAVFSWSYRQLAPDAARMFRLLGLHPGPDTSVPAAASLAAVTVPEARRLLRDLARAYLVTEHAPGRYAFHDLLRAYAADRARDTETEPGRREAVGRVLDHYLHTASSAADLLGPGWGTAALAEPRPGTVPEPVADHGQALAWFEAEHRVLIFAASLADSSGFDTHARQLPLVVARFVYAPGQHQRQAAIRRTALTAAMQLGATALQAIGSRLMAAALPYLRDNEEARGVFNDSIEMYRQLGDRLGEAKAQQALGVLAETQDRWGDALDNARRALREFRAAGDKAGESVALSRVGWCRAHLGDYGQARMCGRRALAVGADTGHRELEEHGWYGLCYAEHHLGNLGEAAACYQRVLGSMREPGDGPVEAALLTHLGDARHAAGDLPRAREAWRQALVIYEDLQDPGTDEVRARLEGLS